MTEQRGEVTNPVTIVAGDQDSIESIAYAHGLFHETIWEDEGNAALRAARPHRNELRAGDRVVVPPRRQKVVSVATGRRHRFRRRGVPAVLRLQLLLDGLPRAAEPYRLVIGDITFTGTTDDRGLIDHWIPPDARSGMLFAGDDPIGVSLRLGGLDPVTDLRGAQQRLLNLGYDCGPPDGTINDDTRAALRAFQARSEIAVTGEYDEATCQALAALQSA